MIPGGRAPPQSVDTAFRACRPAGDLVVHRPTVPALVGQVRRAAENQGVQPGFVG